MLGGGQALGAGAGAYGPGAGAGYLGANTGISGAMASAGLPESAAGFSASGPSQIGSYGLNSYDEAIKALMSSQSATGPGDTPASLSDKFSNTYNKYTSGNTGMKNVQVAQALSKGLLGNGQQSQSVANHSAGPYAGSNVNLQSQNPTSDQILAELRKKRLMAAFSQPGQQ